MKTLLGVVAIEVVGCVALTWWLVAVDKQNKKDEEKINTLKDCIRVLDLQMNQMTNRYEYKVAGKA